MNVQQQAVLTGVNALLCTLPEADKAAVLKALFAENSDGLSAQDRQALLKVLPEGSLGRETPLRDGSCAIEMQGPVNGQIIRAVLSDSSFNKTRSDQGSYAQGLGGRLATREENCAVAIALLEKEKRGTLNPAEGELLRTYREKFVRDSEGGLDVVGRRVDDVDDWLGYAFPSYGALIVLPLAESK